MNKKRIYKHMSNLCFALAMVAFAFLIFGCAVDPQTGKMGFNSGAALKATQDPGIKAVADATPLGIGGLGLALAGLLFSHMSRNKSSDAKTAANDNLVDVAKQAINAVTATVNSANVTGIRGSPATAAVLVPADVTAPVVAK